MSVPIMSDRISQSEAEPDEVIELDPRGDFIFAIQDKQGKLVRKVRCFSQILKFVSPVLAKMLGPDYKEGARLQTEETAVITISERYPYTMAQMLQILHFHGTSPSFDGLPHSIAAVVVQADKYDCAFCLQFWVATASSRLLTQECKNQRDIGHLLFAGFLCSAPNLDRIVQHAVLSLPMKFLDEWEEDQIISRLPEKVTDYLTITTSSLLAALQLRIYKVQVLLSANTHGSQLLVHPQCSLCRLCGRAVYDTDTHSCGTKHIVPYLCTGESRVREFFQHLRGMALWPEVEKFRDYSIYKTLAKLKLEPIDHSCQDGRSCPLKVQMRKLHDDCDQLIEDAYVPMKKLASLLH